MVKRGLRIRRNCTTLEDFNRQAGTLTQRFLEKDYDPVILEATLNQVRNSDRDLLLRDRVDEPTNVNGNSNKFSLITNFSTHLTIKRIMQKHWPILQNNRVFFP